MPLRTIRKYRKVILITNCKEVLQCKWHGLGTMLHVQRLHAISLELYVKIFMHNKCMTQKCIGNVKEKVHRHNKVKGRGEKMEWKRGKRKVIKF